MNGPLELSDLAHVLEEVVHGWCEEHEESDYSDTLRVPSQPVGEGAKAERCEQEKEVDESATDWSYNYDENDTVEVPFASQVEVFILRVYECYLYQRQDKQEGDWVVNKNPVIPLGYESEDPQKTDQQVDRQHMLVEWQKRVNICLEVSIAIPELHLSLKKYVRDTCPINVMLGSQPASFAFELINQFIEVVLNLLFDYSPLMLPLCREEIGVIYAYFADQEIVDKSAVFRAENHLMEDREVWN